MQAPEQNRSLTPFFCVMALYYLASNFVHPVTPTLIVERGLDSALFGLALAAMMTTNFLFAPLWGRLCGYLPTRRILCAGCLGYAAGQVLFACARTGAAVLAGRVLAGAFVGGVFTACYNYTVNVSGAGRRARSLTILMTIQNACSAAGYLVGGLLGLVSVEFAFGVQCAALVAAGVLFRLLCADDTPFKPRPDRPLALRDADPFAAFAGARRFMTPLLGLLFGAIALVSLGHHAYEQCFNYFLKDQYGLSSAWNGGVKAGVAAVTLLLNSTVCLWLQRRTDTNRSAPAVLAAALALTAAALACGAMWPFLCIYVLYSGVYALCLPLLQALVVSRGADYSNAVMGFYQATTSLGGIFGSALAGLLYGLWPRLPFVLAVTAWGGAVAVAWVYSAKQRKI